MPSQRHVSTCSCTAANVSVCDAGSTPGSARYAMRGSPSTSPAVYWPRTASTSGSTRCTDFSTSTLWSRIISASHSAGGSIVANVIIWMRWFCTMSRSAPMPS